MDKHTFIGKRRLGTTDLADFTDYQGVGHDPLYKRYATVENVVKREIPSGYRSFLAIPDYIPSDDTINWYIPEWKEVPRKFTDLEGNDLQKYRAIKEKTLSLYKSSLDRLSGEDLRLMASALRYVNDEFIFCADGNVYVLAWGMTPDTNRHISTGLLVHDAPEFIKPQEPEPEPVVPAPPPVPPAPVEELPPALPEFYECRFNAGERGTLEGSQTLLKAPGSFIIPQEVPPVKPIKGFIFQGWDPDPCGSPINKDMDFVAIYDTKLPWYKRFWAWLGSLGWVKWLLLALIVAFLTFLILWLCRGCERCNRFIPVNGVVQPDTRVVEGDTVDDFGHVKPIILKDGKLPGDKPFVASPITEEDGSLPPIISEEGVPEIIANRLILFLEDDNGDIDALARDFKEAYPGSEYQIIGFDRDVKSLVIQIPENQRETLRETLPQKLPNQPFIVFDEEIYELNAVPGDSPSAPHGWHLKAVKAPEGWEITKGSADVKVAIIDDGIDASHPIFKGRIKDAYNVYTQNNQLGTGDGHGTHTAALAVGSLEYLNDGAAGIAPECTLIPVQVADRNVIPLSALVSGIMYAVHKDADVINVSIAPSFPGLNLLPPTVQDEIGKTKFKNVEKLWNRVSRLAAAKNSIVVFAAGNDDIISRVPPENRSDFAITVGAVDSRLYPTEFTNYGACTDISAPGTGIYSAMPGGRFQEQDGTSMAAPIVTGAIALMKTLKKDLNVEQARNVLYKTGLQVYGYMPPMVQINLALEAVKNDDFSTPDPRPYRPVPEGAIGGIEGEPPTSWVDTTPYVGVIPGQGSIDGVAPGTGTVILPWETVPVTPGTETVIPGAERDGGVVPGSDTNQEVVPGTNPGDVNGNGNGNDSDANQQGGDDAAEIRRMIQYHKDKIKELEKKLENRRRS